MEIDSLLHIGLDIGSTTVKLIIIDDERNILFKEYVRHRSDIKESLIALLEKVYGQFGDRPITVKAAGSAGISIAEWLDIPFVQEVVASSRAIEELIPQTDVAIELGGEDAKITYFDGAIDQRMNGTCAGGTGAFIDQMAALLKTDADGLNELAKGHSVIYPIASRCGVFAKTDVQPLLNEGAAKADIAASILQAVVNQTIGGLSQGKPIRGRVAFLGGPLSFMSELRARFIESLKLKDEEVIFPEELARYFVALGAAIESTSEEPCSFQRLVRKLPGLRKATSFEVQRLRPLFHNEKELEDFRRRHDRHRAKEGSLEDFSGPCFLGIDAGSTTTKAALIGEDGAILYHFYDSNHGSPLQSTIRMLKELYGRLPGRARIAGAVVTGYGEALLKAALQVDIGEIETVAHYKAANYFLPGVDFILDIGGQDMKCLRIRDGIIDEILLNEACSSGCGSFIETFAANLEMNIEQFAESALLAKQPVDLGSRCTVFMNSRVKQAQKEGVTVGDISAGLSYSVIKNALTKVIKIKNPEELGDKIIVQGGSFYNEAILRAFERIAARQAVRPNIAGLMGAFGAALIARERIPASRRTSLLSLDALADFSAATTMDRCGQCGNNCLLTVSTFSDGRTYITGNRCEKGAGGGQKTGQDLPNLYRYKNERLFDYRPIKKKDARAVVGIPRALNMFENYPFWHTFLSELGYRVLLSTPSSQKGFESGMDSIPSESVCYPAKLVHGHIMNLIKRGVDFIWYPSIPYEKKEDPGATNHYNCPIVAGYPEVIRANVSGLMDCAGAGARYGCSKNETAGEEGGVPIRIPYFSMQNKHRLMLRLFQEFRGDGFSFKEIRRAVDRAWEEKERYKEDIRRKGLEVLKELEEKKLRAVVLSGRPYHVDPEINHGIPDIINQLGMAVLTEDSVSHLAEVKRPIRVVDQWVYHNRLYAAAHYVGKNRRVELVQLTSFGCGLDAITGEQIHEILHEEGRIYTSLKIDEGNQLGAARIRLRSLKAVMDERERSGMKPKKSPHKGEKVPFTKEMRKTHTILAPQMAPIHFELVQEAFQRSGYKLHVLPSVDHEAVEIGLKYVHNDACYPTIIVVGQLLKALQSGEYDTEKVALLITQTGGGCRATNYIAFLRKAVAEAGYGNIPIISLNAMGMEANPGFRIGRMMLLRNFQGLVYGDLLMRVLLKTRPYEVQEGSAEALFRKWMNKIRRDLKHANRFVYHRNIRRIIREFDELPLRDEVKPRVGLVGEILVKFHPTANNQVIKVLEREGVEAVVPDLLDFFLYTAHTGHFKRSHLSGTRKQRYMAGAVIHFLEGFRRVMRRELNKSRRFEAPPTIYELAERTKPVVSVGAIMGEGWFLTGEMIELIESGADNVVVMQPFACLPNQITGKGMIKILKKKYPKANIAAIDYDPGASEVNQLNRIKLMLSVAFKKLDAGGAAKPSGRTAGSAAAADKNGSDDKGEGGSSRGGEKSALAG